MSNKKLSSVDCLENEIDFILKTYSYNSQDFHLNKAFEKAKAMHKEEQVNTFRHAQALMVTDSCKRAEQYYQETFGGNNE